MARDPSHRPLAGVSARARYVALALATILLGLAVHLWGGVLGRAPRDLVGDALWAGMMAWWVAAAVPSAPMRLRAAAALVICFAVEIGQLYHSPGIDALRRTTLGHLVLGSDFDGRDLFAYSAGLLAAVLLERAAVTRRKREPQPVV